MKSWPSTAGNDQKISGLHLCVTTSPPCSALAAARTSASQSLLRSASEWQHHTNRGYDNVNLDNNFIANKYHSAALGLAALAAAGSAPAVAQPSVTWSAGVSTRNGRPFVHAALSSSSGYGAYAQARAIQPLVPNYRATVPSSLGRDPFGMAGNGKCTTCEFQSARR
jgi:hypothetical protein